MAYIRKIIAKDEELVGVARLHWIYVIRGLVWFFGLAFTGWAMDSLMTRGLFALAQSTGADSMAFTLMSLSSGAMLFMLAGGFLVFSLFVLKVLVTEVGLSNRRVILKEGWIFVKIHNIDLEEVRGESMDTGYLGRFLGYAYVMLDCRFIGDVKLPAIESAERFMRALQKTRVEIQDTLPIVIGKGNRVFLDQGDGTPKTPEAPEPTAPEPEILPGQQPAEPEIKPADLPEKPEFPTRPVPHSPEPPSAPPPAPQAPPAQPTQPIAPPISPEPPLQPPSDGTQAQAVAAIVQQVMPQMARQVVKEMAEQGLIQKEQPVARDDNDIDTALIDSFDEARMKEGGRSNDLHDKMEHAIH